MGKIERRGRKFKRNNKKNDKYDQIVEVFNGTLYFLLQRRTFSLFFCKFLGYIYVGLSSPSVLKRTLDAHDDNAPVHLCKQVTIYP